MHCLIPLLLLLGPAQLTDFQAGFAEADVSPKLGMEQPGGYGKVFHQSFHDACKARAAVFRHNGTTVALVGLDALGIDRRSVLRVREQIQTKCGIPGPNILIGASHSHSSGPVGMVMPGDYDHSDALVRKLAYDDSSMADLKYLETMEAGIVDAVCKAHSRLSVSTAAVGKGLENQVAFNRRFRMKNGMTMTHPGQNNPDILEPAGPVDPEVIVLAAWNAEGKLTGCVVNFCCHATTNPGGISANYVHYIEKVIQGYYGKDCPVVFLNGNSGDVTQVDNRNPKVHRKPEPWAEFVGGRVGAEALKVLLTLDRLAKPIPLATATKTEVMTKRPPSPDRLAKALQLVKGDQKKADPTEWAFAKEAVLLNAQIQKFPTAEVEVQVIQVGPLAYITNPAEFFCDFGLEQKKQSGFPFTCPVSLANGCVGYVPTAEAFSGRGGGYETRLTSYSNLKVGSGERITAMGIELAKSLKPGPVTEAPNAPPFKGQPWSYGSVPPEIR